ncbi:MAG: redoxin domain-containing protein, partial [Bacteroidota bacterium]
MALTESTMLKLGTTAPKFNLLDVRSGNHITYENIKGQQGTLVYFICNHCPYVVHVIEELVRVSNEYLRQGIGTVFISSNDVVKYPADGPYKMKDFAIQYGFQFPYLYDESQDVANS